jgi:hypothetical protein
LIHSDDVRIIYVEILFIIQVLYALTLFSLRTTVNPTDIAIICHIGLRIDGEGMMPVLATEGTMKNRRQGRNIKSSPGMFGYLGLHASLLEIQNLCGTDTRAFVNASDAFNPH